jgi:hypothetical protein
MFLSRETQLPGTGSGRRLAKILILMLAALLLTALASGCEVRNVVEGEEVIVRPGIGAWIGGIITNLILLVMLFIIATSGRVVGFGNAFVKGGTRVVGGGWSLEGGVKGFAIIYLIIAMVVSLTILLLQTAIWFSLIVLRFMLPIVVPYGIFLILSKRQSAKEARQVQQIQQMQQYPQYQQQYQQASYPQMQYPQAPYPQTQQYPQMPYPQAPYQQAPYQQYPHMQYPPPRPGKPTVSVVIASILWFFLFINTFLMSGDGTFQRLYYAMSLSLSSGLIFLPIGQYIRAALYPTLLPGIPALLFTLMARKRYRKIRQYDVVYGGKSARQPTGDPTMFVGFATVLWILYYITIQMVLQWFMYFVNVRLTMIGSMGQVAFTLQYIFPALIAAIPAMSFSLKAKKIFDARREASRVDNADSAMDRAVAAGNTGAAILDGDAATENTGAAIGAWAQHPQYPNQQPQYHPQQQYSNPQQPQYSNQQPQQYPNQPQPQYPNPQQPQNQYQQQPQYPNQQQPQYSIPQQQFPNQPPSFGQKLNQMKKSTAGLKVAAVVLWVFCFIALLALLSGFSISRVFWVIVWGVAAYLITKRARKPTE